MKPKESPDASFYNGGRKTHWAVVAFAMIGSCMSGVTFVSVPGMVGTSSFGYLQMCLGFFLGYLVIAFVLTPLYFKRTGSAWPPTRRAPGSSSSPRCWAHRSGCSSSA